MAYRNGSKIKMKKSAVVAISIAIVLLISVFTTMLLFKITDYGITIASFAATLFMVLSDKKIEKRKIFGSYAVAAALGYGLSRLTDFATFNVALAAIFSVIAMTLLEFQHPPAIGISIAMVLNKFGLFTDIVIVSCIFILIFLVFLVRVFFFSPEKLKNFVEIREEKIKWNLKKRKAPEYVRL